jgi:hypothetical protein
VQISARALRAGPWWQALRIRPDLLALFDQDELKKYITDDELAGLEQK